MFLWYYKILVYLKSLFCKLFGTPFSGVKLLQNPSVDTSIAVSLAMSVKKHDPLGAVVFSYAAPNARSTEHDSSGNCVVIFNGCG